MEGGTFLSHLRFDNKSLSELPVDTRTLPTVRSVAGAVCKRWLNLLFFSVLGVQAGVTFSCLYEGTQIRV